MIDLDKKCAIEKCWICAKCCLYYPPNDKEDFILAGPDLIKWRLNNRALEPNINEKALMLDILKRYTTGEIVEEEKEKESMENAEIIKELEEAIELNKEARSKNNDAMCHAKNALVGVCKDSKTYEQGLEEAWEIARKIIVLEIWAGGYSNVDMDEIFGKDRLTRCDILRTIDIHEVKAKIEAWEAEKAKLKLGDVVECIGLNAGGKFVGIYCGKNDTNHWIIKSGECRPVTLNTGCWHLEKTSKHFDIQSMLDEIG